MNNKNIIELLNNISELNLNELVELCDKIASKYGYESVREFLNAMNPNVGGSSASDEETEDTSPKLCNLALVAVDASKRTAVIRKIKDELKCTSLQAKEKSEHLPMLIRASILIMDADALIKDWAEAGATLEKQPASS